MNPLMNKIVITIILSFSFFSNAMASEFKVLSIEEKRIVEAQKRRGGSFTFGREIIENITGELSLAISALTDAQESSMVRYILEMGAPILPPNDPEMVYKDPKTVNRAYLANLISRVELLEDENTKDSRRHFFWEYNNQPDRYTIFALEPFFLDYSKRPFSDMPSSDIAEIRFKLLKEVAHTWGFNDDQAETFSRKILSILLFPNPRGQGCYPKYHVASEALFGFNKDNYRYIKQIIKEAEGGIGNNILDFRKHPGERIFQYTCRLSGKAMESEVDHDAISEAIRFANKSESLCPDGTLIQTYYEFTRLIEAVIIEKLRSGC